jgi:hypothetical protein
MITGRLPQILRTCVCAACLFFTEVALGSRVCLSWLVIPAIPLIPASFASSSAAALQHSYYN